jgi:hypothetical protein
MIREDYEDIKVWIERIQEILVRAKHDVVGCGIYCKKEDRFCGHRYSWVNPKNNFKMEVWLCDRCKQLNQPKTEETKHL